MEALQGERTVFYAHSCIGEKRPTKPFLKLSPDMAMLQVHPPM